MHHDTSNTHHPRFDVDAAATGDMTALDEATQSLIEIGEQALADENAHGKHWTLYADWAWRAGVTAIGSATDDVQRWIDDDGPRHDLETVAATLKAISTVHAEHDLADPVRGVQA